MATKKPEPKKENVGREYVIPFRDKVRVVPRYKKTNKAVKTVKEFLVRHMKVRDRDLNKIKIDKYLNEALWARGIRKPPHKIRVKAIQDGEFIRVELAELPTKLKFKKAREEKAVQKAKELLEGKKSRMAKMKEGMQEQPSEEGAETPEEQKEGAEKKAEEKEKKAAVVEAGAKREKAAAQTEKKSAKAAGKMTQQKHQQRKALAK